MADLAPYIPDDLVDLFCLVGNQVTDGIICIVE
jgi:hypothetical protein